MSVAGLNAAGSVTGVPAQSPPCGRVTVKLSKKLRAAGKIGAGGLTVKS